jgi:hypothetical protein
MAALEPLRNIIRVSTDDVQQVVLLHANDVGKRDYSAEELASVKKRDFESRLLITGINIEGLTVRLRTHHTDDHKFTSYLNYVRDYFKAAHATKNNTAAKATLTDLLTIFFTCDRSSYYSFALTLASALSNQGENTSFEIDDSMVKNKKQMAQARKEFCLHMDILFDSIYMEKFLVCDEGSNTFRLVYCQTKHTKDKIPFVLAFISFLIQVCLTGYVLGGVADSGVLKDFYGVGLVRNLPLAVLTFLYSAILAYPIVSESADSYRLYKKKGLLYVMDFTVNSVIPLVLLFAGFFVIIIQESFIEAVLNTAALLFIPEIDDQLPSLLGLKEEAIVHNHLVSEAVMQYGAVMRHINKAKKEPARIGGMKIKDSIGIQLNDFYITNIPEQGSDPRNGELFQPYQVRVSVEDGDYQIDPSQFITEHCLIRRMEWSYTNRYPMTTKPRVGYLRLEKMNGEVITIEEKGADNESVGVSNKRHSLAGAFIITTFQMSNAIIKLRVCGSYEAEDFLKAFEYYSLWDISPRATSLLKKEARSQITNAFT